MEKEKQLKVILNWVNDLLRNHQVPKFAQVIDHAYRELGYKNLKPSEIKKALKLLPPYEMTSVQQRKKQRGKRHRPMIVNTLGCLHADIGFYAVTREYETPVTYRAGFLVAKDTLSRYTYVSILRGSRTAESVEKGFQDILQQFRKQNNGEHVKSVSFDQERSIMGGKMQAFFKKKNISFHAFQNTASKSKMAEGAIRLIRNAIARNKANVLYNKEIRWWHLIHSAVDNLNSEPIAINGKYLLYIDQSVQPYYTPKSVNSTNLNDFISKLQKAAPAYFFAQFGIDSRFVQFEFQVGDFVRPKLIITSSEVIGTKRSEVTLKNEIFIIQKQLPYVSRQLTIEKAYVCKSTKTGDLDVFDQDDLALAPPPISQ